MNRLHYQHLNLLNWGLLGVLLLVVLAVSVTLVSAYNTLGNSDNIMRNMKW